MRIPKVEASLEFREAGRYLTHLIFCGLHGKAPNVIPKEITWDDVFQLARSSATEGVSWFAVQACDGMPEDIRKAWQSMANVTTFKMIMFAEERDRVFAALSEQGISHLAVKGALLAEYYPHPGMRSMCDNDILYGFIEELPEGGFRVRGKNEEERSQAEAQAKNALTKTMLSLGFVEKYDTDDKCEAFEKAPMLAFEMHHTLVRYDHQHADYYSNPWLRAIPDSEDPYLLRFSDEDEYLYFLSHAFRHLYEDGCGIRYLVDTYVILARKGAQLDWDYVSGELARMGLTDYERKMKELAYAVFEDESALDEEQENLLLYFLGCAVHGACAQGDYQERYRLKLQNFHEQLRASEDPQTKSGFILKWRYALSRIFIREEIIQEQFPLFYKHKVLRPLLPFYRLGKFLICNPEHAKAELNVLLSDGDSVSHDLKK